MVTLATTKNHKQTMTMQSQGSRFTLLLFFCNLILSGSAYAGQKEYDDCILKYLKGAKQDVAAHLITQACDENYKNPSFTSDKRKAYNQCLLENLVGVESLRAVTEIQNACHRKHR